MDRFVVVRSALRRLRKTSCDFISKVDNAYSLVVFSHQMMKGITKLLRLLRRVFPVSFLLCVLFIAVSSGNAFASQRPTHPSKDVTSPSVKCYAIMNDYSSISYSGSGNAAECTPAGESDFIYQSVSPGNNQLTGSWDFISSRFNFFQSCDIDAWFPYGNLSSGTKAHYDFWDSDGWLGWVGQDINQYSAPAGWNRIATNITINDGGRDVKVTLHNDGGSGNLAFAAMRFTCN